jgi:tRNA A37 threonylcarbamoyladenosine dehydratase
VDSLNPKTQILAYCHEKKIPGISSMGAAQRMNLFSIKAGDLFKATGCRLASYVRSRLRRRGIQNGIFCIYSDTPLSEEPVQKTRILNEEQDKDRGRQRHKLGSAPTVTGAFGLAVAHHALLYLTGDLKLD